MAFSRVAINRSRNSCRGRCDWGIWRKPLWVRAALRRKTGEKCNVKCACDRDRKCDRERLLNPDAIKLSRNLSPRRTTLERLGIDVELEIAWEEVFDSHEPIVSLAEQQIISTADQPSSFSNGLVGLPSHPAGLADDGFRLTTNHGLNSNHRAA